MKDLTFLMPEFIQCLSLISDFGKESSVSLANLKAEDVLKQVEKLSQTC